MSVADLLSMLPWAVAGGMTLGAAGIAASVHNTRLKIKHGYPLEGMWGQSLRPGAGSDAMERIKLLSQENAGLRAELGSLKDRLGNIERIVTDQGFGVHHQIEALRDRRAGASLSASVHKPASDALQECN
jgi:hypothetical protein